MERLYYLAEEVSAASRNVPVEHFCALSILNGLEKSEFRNLVVWEHWNEELERILAMNALVRVKMRDVVLQFRGQRFAKAPILEIMLPETMKAWTLSQTAKDRTTVAACLEEKERLFHCISELQMQYTTSRTGSESVE